MAVSFQRDVPNPLLLPEILGLVIDNVHMAADLLNCACVNSFWSMAARRKLYSGSLTDMQFRTPDITTLNCLFVASRERFAQNMSFMKHLLLLPETPSLEEKNPPTHTVVCYEKLRLLRQKNDAKLLFRPRGRVLDSITIPFEMMSQDWSPADIEDLVLSPVPEFLAIDYSYCPRLFTLNTSSPHMFARTLTHDKDRFTNLKALTIYKQDINEHGLNLSHVLISCNLRFFHYEEGIKPGRFSSGGHQYISVGLTAIPTFLQCLRQQKHLETVALISPQPYRDLFHPRHDGSDDPLATGIDEEYWPNLKTLYLREEPRNWLQQLPTWKNIQILTLRNIPHSHTARAIESVAQCKNLRVLNLQLDKLQPAEKLVEIAESCPLLQKFHVDFQLRLGQNEKIEHRDAFLNLLLVMPNVEILELGLRLNLDESILRDLTRSCPRLVSIRLRNSSLVLTPSAMHSIDPFHKLEFLYVSGVSFEHPSYFMSDKQMDKITTEWRRIFPKLRGTSCIKESFTTHQSTEFYDEHEGYSDDEHGGPDGAWPFNWQRNNDDEGSQYTDEIEETNSSDFLSEPDELGHEDDLLCRVRHDIEDDEKFADEIALQHGMSREDLIRTLEDGDYETALAIANGVPRGNIAQTIEGPGTEVDNPVKDEDQADRPEPRLSQQRALRELWKTLGFEKRMNSQATFSRMWQMEMEVAISGWPVVPLYAFNDPTPYSSSFKKHRKSAEEYAYTMTDPYTGPF